MFQGSLTSLSKAPSLPSPGARSLDATQRDRRSLHQLNQVPRSRFNENWLNPDASKKPAQRRSDVMRQAAPMAQHWVVEEAERRRLAEQSGKERLQKLHSRQQQQQQQARDVNTPHQSSAQRAAPNYVNVAPSSEAQPYIEALKQAGVYASPNASSYPAVQSYNPYPVGADQPKYPNGLYTDDTGYPTNYQRLAAPELASGYQGGTTNPQPAAPGAVQHTRLPPASRHGSNPQLTQSSYPVAPLSSPGAYQPHARLSQPVDNAPSIDTSYSLHTQALSSSHSAPALAASATGDSGAHSRHTTSSAPAKPPRTFSSDSQSAAPDAYVSSQLQRSPASDSSESAPLPPVPPKSLQLLQAAAAAGEPLVEQIVAVAGHQRCAHCHTELG